MDKNQTTTTAEVTTTEYDIDVGDYVKVVLLDKKELREESFVVRQTMERAMEEPFTKIMRKYATGDGQRWFSVDDLVVVVPRNEIADKLVTAWGALQDQLTLVFAPLLPLLRNFQEELASDDETQRSLADESREGVTINEIQKEVHETNVRKGWWDKYAGRQAMAGKRWPPIELTTDEMLSKLALVTSEVAEAMEDVRVGKMTTTYEEDGKPVGFPSELADIVIRVLDIAESQGVNLEKEIRIKLDYNKTRKHRHGAKLA